MNPEVDAYIRQSEQWPEELAELRPVLLGSGLTEDIKWGKPCYTHDGKNIVILQEMKGFLAIMFFKGGLLTDPDGVLRAQGPNSRSARRIEIGSTADVKRLTGTIETYIAEAIDVERRRLTLDPAPDLVLVDELQQRLDRDPALGAAFDALTPGRQREYNLYFSSAKRAETRSARIDKHARRIMDGKGLRDR